MTANASATTLQRLRDDERVRSVDLALADTLQRLDPATPADVLAAAALASLAVGRGHAAFDPAQPQLLLDGDTAWPPVDAWMSALQASPWVCVPDRDAVADPARPLVLEGGLLYLRRYREYERRLAAGLRRLAMDDATPVDVDTLEPLFDALFPLAGGIARAAQGDDHQARAALRALSTSLLLVTGAPGTGKTTTIARVLLLLIAQARDRGPGTGDRGAGTATATAASRTTPLRIALAAPTGRAAERMASSLRAIAATLRDTAGIDPALCDALPADARTLHRLLGSIPDSPRFRHDVGTPLPFDVVVVDEASMVDLPLMCKLVDAVAPGARLILLGDRDQLPSVEAGDVLAAIGDAMGDDVGSARRHDVDGAAADKATSADAIAARGALAGHRVHLRRGYRQSASLDLAPLADAVRDGDIDRALPLLRDGALAGVHFHDGLSDPLRGATRDALLAPWRALLDCRDPAEALRLAGRMRLLTALRDGPQGARQLNARIEDALAGTQRATYFHGRLLLITENSPRHGLFNGDIGVCLRTDAGTGAAPATGDGTRAWFAGGSGSCRAGSADRALRAFHPSALPAHDGAFAMTVHKSQGSEFDTVWLLLPERTNRVLSRELVYTAITRARSELHIAAHPAIITDALARHAARWSGLGWRLGV